jgi:2-keto-4-pentenoate hydratase/2-oxohepta-3-ene-1,7-dioic acid hydratase in catechol pathway
MKLVRYGKAGKEKPGLIDMDGRIRDLSEVVGDIGGDTLSPKSLRKIARLRPGNLPLVRGKPRLGSCVSRPGNFIAIGLNYADHAAEAGAKIPAEPIIFMKATNCVVGPNDDIVIPKGSTKTDWEIELAIVIGTGGSHITEKNALEHVAGFCVCNDVSEREYQVERSGGQWDKGKGCPTFGPLGPWLVTPDEIKDVQKLDLWLDVNGARQQTGNTATMIFGVKHLVSYVSRFMKLEPGDVITTGTPPGVALGRKPPNYLRAGDTISCGIEGLGQQASRVVAWKKDL